MKYLILILFFTFMYVFPVHAQQMKTIAKIENGSIIKVKVPKTLKEVVGNMTKMKEKHQGKSCYISKSGIVYVVWEVDGKIFKSKIGKLQ